MRKNRISAVAAIAFCLATWAFAQNTVKATGTAAIFHGDVAQARDKAIDNALRTAVERVVGTMVDSESMVNNNELISDKIYTRTTGYISGYKILSEKKDTDLNIYSVTVEAQVNKGNLTHDLKSIGILIRRMKMPRVAVALREEGGSASGTILQLLKNKGFNVVDTGSQTRSAWFYTMPQNRQVDLLKKYGAEVVILGNAGSSYGGNVGKSHLRSYHADVSLKALKTDTHEVIGTASGSGKAVDVSDSGRNQALRQAATIAGNSISGSIISQWSKESSSTRLVVLEVLTNSALKAGQFVKRLPSEGRGIENVIVREKRGRTTTLNVYMKGDASDLAGEIKKIFPTARVVSQSADKLTISL